MSTKIVSMKSIPVFMTTSLRSALTRALRGEAGVIKLIE